MVAGTVRSMALRRLMGIASQNAGWVSSAIVEMLRNDEQTSLLDRCCIRVAVLCLYVEQKNLCCCLFYLRSKSIYVSFPAGLVQTSHYTL